jgi:hypothetical protein
MTLNHPPPNGNGFLSFFLSDSGAMTVGIRPKSPQRPCTRPVIGSSRCSVCEVVELRGGQTVCSAACRRERSRRREVERRPARDREIAALLEAVLRTLEKGSP